MKSRLELNGAASRGCMLWKCTWSSFCRFFLFPSLSELHSFVSIYLSCYTWADNESCRTAWECGDSLSFAFGVYIVVLSARCTVCTIHSHLSAAYALSDSLSTCTVHSCIRHVPHTLYVCAMWWRFRCEGKLQYTIFYFCKIKFSQSLSVFAVGSAFYTLLTQIFVLFLFFE